MDINQVIEGSAIEFCEALEDNSVNLFWGDPPFGTGNMQQLNSNKKSYQDLTPEEVVDLLVSIAIEAQRFLMDDGVLVFCLDYRAVHEVATNLNQILVPQGEIVWHFETGGLKKSWWGNKHNTCLLYSKTSKPKFDFDAVPTITRKAPKKGYTDPKKISSVWGINMSTTDPQRVGYPTQKPEELVKRFVEVHTEPGDLVVDPFCGSGTTGAVAAKLDRNWLMNDALSDAVAVSTARLEAIAVLREAESAQQKLAVSPLIKVEEENVNVPKDDD